MSPEQNKAVVRRNIEEAMNRGNLAVVDETYTPDAVLHIVGGPVVVGRDAVRQQEFAHRAAFPDTCYTIDDIFAVDDRVIVRCTFRGTQQGELPGIAPTGKPVNVSSIFITRFIEQDGEQDGGKVAEQWLIADTLGMLRQLGVVPDAALATA